MLVQVLQWEVCEGMSSSIWDTAKLREAKLYVDEDADELVLIADVLEKGGDVTLEDLPYYFAVGTEECTVDPETVNKFDQEICLYID